MANKIIHKRSVITENGEAKLPQSSQLEYGEIAVNYASGFETISMKNSSNEIVEFKSKDYFENIIEENELALASSLTDLNNRVSGITESLTNLNNSVSGIIESLDSKSDEGHTHVSSSITDSISSINGVTDTASELVQGKVVYKCIDSLKTEIETVIEENELALASSLTDLNNRVSGITESLTNLNNSVSGITESLDSKSDEGHTHVSSAITDSISSMSGITGTETKLVQSKAVYELINDTFDSIVTNIEENELVTATAITELESLLNEIGEEFIIGEQNTTTSTFLGTTQSEALFDGKKIIYWLPCDTMEGEPVSLILKLSNNSLVEYPIYINGLTPLTNEYGAGTPIRLIFRENVNVNNTTVSGWWCELEIKKTPYDVITLSNSTVDIPAERGVVLQNNISIPANSIVNFNLTFDVTKLITSNIMIFVKILSQNSGTVSSAAGSIPAFTATSTMIPTTTISFSHYFSKSDIISIGASASDACRFVNALSGANGVMSENNASSIIIIPQ